MAVKNILFKIEAEVGGLAAQLQKVSDKIEELGKTAGKAGKKIKDGLESGIKDSQIDSAISKLIAAEEQAEKKRESNRRKRVESEKKAADDESKIVNKLISELNQLEQTAEKQRDARRKRRVSQEQKAANDEAKIIDKLIAEVNAAEEQAEKQRDARRRKRLAEDKKAADKAAKIADQETKNAAKLAAQSKAQFANIVKGGLAILGIQQGIQALKEFTLEAVRSAAEFQKNQIAFKTFIGSATQANNVLKELTDLAIRTPFTSEQTIQGARVLAAYGFSGEQLTSIIERLGNIASGTSIPLEQLSLVFGQVKAAGKLMGQDLLQLVNAGFNPLQEISERTGESMASLRKRMGDGAISFREVAESFYYATERGGRFYNLNKQLAETTAGQLDALKEKFQLFTRETGIAFEPVTRGFIDFANTLIDTGKQIGRLLSSSGIFATLVGTLKILDVAFKVINATLGVFSDILDTIANTPGNIFSSFVRDIKEFTRETTGLENLPSTLIPKEEEAKSLTALKKTNEELKKRISLIKSSADASKTGAAFTYDVKGVDELNKVLAEGSKIDKTKITDARDLNAQLAGAYDQLLKQNEIENKRQLYANEKKRAEERIVYYENVKAELAKKFAARENKQATDFLEFGKKNKNINDEIERLKQLIWDADAKSLALINQQGGALDDNADRIGKIVDLYKVLRGLYADIEDLQIKQDTGPDEFSKLLANEKKFDLDRSRLEEKRNRDARIAELQAEKLSEKRSFVAKNEAANVTLSMIEELEIQEIEQKEHDARMLLLTMNYIQAKKDISEPYDEQRIQAQIDDNSRILNNERVGLEDRIKLYEDFINQQKQLVEEAKTKKQFKQQTDTGYLQIGILNFNLEQYKKKREDQIRFDAGVEAQRAIDAGASKSTIVEIYRKADQAILDSNKEIDDKIAENSLNWTAFIVEQQKIRREAILDGWSTLVGEIASLGQQLTDALIAQTERQIEAQEKRVDKAREIADKGNAQILELEQERLDKLNKKRQDAARIAIAIAKTEAIAQASLAVAKAAAMTGPGAPLAIASTITALIAGIAAAAVAISNSGGFEKGGYTGDGGRKEPAGTVHKGEFVFTQEKTRKYRTLFEEIHKGRDPFVAMNYNDKVVVINNNSMNDRLERIEKAIMGQNRMQLHIDEKGIYGIVSEIQYKQDRLRSRF